MTIHVAICDDDFKTVREIESYLRLKNEQLQDEKLEIFTFSSGVEFLQDARQGHKFHIVFMDIEMDGINGIDTILEIRKMTDVDDTIIIYISGYKGYFENLVDTGCFRFIKKPINNANLDDIFNRALKQAIFYKSSLATSRVFRFKISKELHSIKVDKIAYLKITDRLVELYMWNDEKESIEYFEKFYSTLKKTLSNLPSEQFFRCDQSYVVNLNYVSGVRKESFILMDYAKTQIPISKNYRTDAKKIYFNYQRVDI